MKEVKNISPSQLRAICKRMTQQRANHLTPLINHCIQEYQMPWDALPEFLANLAHESGEFAIKTENLNYGKPERLCAVWPSRFSMTGLNGKLNAAQYAGNPKKLANAVYNGRMGNRPASDDGYNFRGGGFAQLTGRDAYTLYTVFVNKKYGSKMTIEQVAELVHTDDAWALDSAFWFFCEMKNLENMALQDNFKELVKRWNGGVIGMAERLEYYNRALEALK